MERHLGWTLRKNRHGLGVGGHFRQQKQHEQNETQEQEDRWYVCRILSSSVRVKHRVYSRIGMSCGVPVLKIGFRPECEGNELLRGLYFILQVKLSQNECGSSQVSCSNACLTVGFLNGSKKKGVEMKFIGSSIDDWRSFDCKIWIYLFVTRLVLLINYIVFSFDMKYFPEISLYLIIQILWNFSSNTIFPFWTFWKACMNLSKIMVSTMSEIPSIS